MSTGILFGILNDIITICDELNVKHLLWFFDSREKIRQEMFAGYKATRNTGPAEQMKLREEAQKTIATIPGILRSIGFRDVHKEKGFEADDLIAQAANQLCETSNQVWVISGDEDLYQTIKPNVNIYQPRDRKYLTWDGFVERYGIAPDRWDEVKALTGCKSDEIPGIPGVGEKTAIKYLMGEPIREALTDLIAESRHLISLNSSLVRLPLPQTPTLDLKLDDEHSPSKWNACLQKYGMASLRKKGYPFK